MAGPAAALPPGGGFPRPGIAPPGPFSLAGPAGALPPGGGFPRPGIAPPGPTSLPGSIAGGLPPLPGGGPGGWVPPVVNHGWAPPGPNIATDPSAMINRGNILANAPQTNIATGDIGNRTANVFAGGWTGVASAEAAAGSRGWGGAYGSDTGGGWGGGYSSYGGGGYSSDYGGGYSSGYGSGWGGGYSSDYGSSSGSGSDTGSSNPYYVPVPVYTQSDTSSSNPYYVPVPVSTEARQGSDSGSSAAAQERNDLAPTSAPSKESAANTDDGIPAALKPRMDAARLAFQKGDYAGAQRECEQAIQLLPRDANLHQFRALCQFAQGKYQDAAATLYAVLSAGPGWDWNTLSSFYTSAEAYTRQLRALEQYVTEHPKGAAGRFVLAYHYLVLDQRDAGRDQLREVVKLQPRDKVSAGILGTLEKAKKSK